MHDCTMAAENFATFANAWPPSAEGGELASHFHNVSNGFYLFAKDLRVREAFNSIARHQTYSDAIACTRNLGSEYAHLASSASQG